MPSAHWASTFLPTATEPVSETLRTTGEAISASASFADGPVMTVIDARRHTGVDQGLGELEAGARCLGGRSGNDRAAGGERRGDLSRREKRRKIPGRQRQAYADRLVDDAQAMVGGAAGNGLSVDALGFLPIPLELVGGCIGLAARLGERLAGLGAHDPGDILDPFADEVGGAAHHLRPVPGGDRPPGRKSPRRAGKDRSDVGGIGRRHFADPFLRRRRVDRHRPSRRGPAARHCR